MSEAKQPVLKPCEQSCPKCGGADIYRVYRRKGEAWTVCDRKGDRASEYIDCSTDWHRAALKEFIANHCRTCQFDWQTEPLKP